MVNDSNLLATAHVETILRYGGNKVMRLCPQSQAKVLLTVAHCFLNSLSHLTGALSD